MSMTFPGDDTGLLAVARPCQQLLAAIWRSCRRLGIRLKAGHRFARELQGEAFCVVAADLCGSCEAPLKDHSQLPSLRVSHV